MEKVSTFPLTLIISSVKYLIEALSPVQKYLVEALNISDIAQAQYKYQLSSLGLSSWY